MSRAQLHAVDRTSKEPGTPEQGRTTLTALVATLAAETKAAVDAEEAMYRCLEHIAKYGRWTLGRFARVTHEASGAFRRGSMWLVSDAQRFAELIRHSDCVDTVNAQGPLVGRMLREKQPVWIADMTALTEAPRLRVAMRLGLRSVFAFPVLVHGEVTACFEFFAEDVREPDRLLIAQVGGIGSELARLIEREQDTASSARLAAIVRNSNDAIIGRTLEGTITFWNAGAERMLGYTAAEAIGRSVTFTLPPGGATKLEANTEKLLHGEPVAPYESQRMTKDGRMIPVLTSHSPVKDLAGSIIAASTILQDISALKGAERALKASEQRYSAIVQSSNDAIVSRAPDGTIQSWNAAAERMFGWSAQEALGKPITIIVPPERSGEMRPLIKRVLAGETLGAVESRHCRKDGTRFDTSVSLSAMRNAAGEIEFISFFYRDITDFKKLQRESQSKAGLANLIEGLARAANEADTPAAALEVCLQRICEHGQWQLGHAVVFKEGMGLGEPALSISRIEDRERHKSCIGPLDRRDYSTGGSTFAKRAATTAAPVWIADMTTTRIGSRLTCLAANGMRRAFAFPVVAHGEVLALLEFFGSEPRPVDDLLIANIASVAAQLARLIERQRAFATLRESETQLRLITENTPAMIAYFDGDQRCRFANRSYCEFNGIDRSRIIGMTLEEITGADVYTAISPSLPEVRQGDVSTHRRTHRTAAGEIRQVEVRRVADLSPEGGFRGHYAMLLDVTEQVRAEAKIRTSEARVRAIFDSEPECVKVMRPDGFLIDMNRSGLVALEVESIEQAREHGLMHFVLPAYRERLAEFVRRNMNGEPCTLEFEIEGMKGTHRWMKSHATPFRLPDEQEGALLVITRDITGEKQAQEKADYLSYHDALTGLPNRNLFQDRLERAVAQARRRGEVLGIIVLNIDRFGKVNESLGAAAGDELLAAVAQRMQASLRNVDTIARFGGNEFAILVEGIASVDEVTLVAEKLNQAYATSFSVGGQEVFLSASIGIAVFPNGTSDPHVLLQHAGSAMREIKEDGGNGHQLYDGNGKREDVQHIDLECQLRHALENGELDVHYQPKVNIATGAIVGAEALVRWNHPELGVVNPVHFIPIAEETGLVLPIGEWVLDTACRNARSWRDAGFDLEIAVNLSPRQFRHKNLLGIVAGALDASGLAPRNLELEITETVALSRPEHAASLLKNLRDLGVRIALDDFGTGHSSLSHLRRLPLDAVKIDRSFVRDIATNAQDRAIVAGVTALARTLGMRITAEGVEDGVQLENVRQCGCDEYQGYHFSRPLPAAEFRALLERTRVSDDNRPERRGIAPPAPPPRDNAHGRHCEAWTPRAGAIPLQAM